MNFKEDLLIHRFGVNYTPSKNWYFCWNDWEPDSIARDFDAIAALGADHIRLMLIWPYFQPNPTWVSPLHLDRLEQLMGLAHARRLNVLVTVFTGFLSGWHFPPPFYKTGDLYTSPEMFRAQSFMIKALAARLKTHPNLIGFDIGNEINCFATAKLQDGDAWMDKVLTLMEAELPDHVHVNGVDHAPWFHVNTFSPQRLATRQPIVTLHCWIKFTEALRHGTAMQPPCIKLAAAMTALARSYGGDPKKPVWIQEYGASDEWMEAADIPVFLEETTMSAIEEGASWFTWWDSHDVDRKFEFGSLEYGLGLLTSENKPKPQAQAFKEIAGHYRGKPVVIPQRPLPPPPVEQNDAATWRWLLDWIAGAG